MRLMTLLFCLLFTSLAQAQEAVPRQIIALYNSKEEATQRTTQIHRFLEMPLNHLGYDVRYFDVYAPLPPLGPEVHAIVIWFNSGTEVPDANLYLDWLDTATRQGKHLVVMENIGIGDNYRKDPAIIEKMNKILGRIGVQDTNLWQSLAYQAKISYKDPAMVEYERPYESIRPYTGTNAVGPDAVSHLKISIKEGEDTTVSDLVITSPRGGYVAEDFALFHVVEEGESKIHQWYINPFLFLKRALQSDTTPKPDITTLNGKRIFYSHIDGDGWNNISEISTYNKSHTLASEVVRKEILEPYRDFVFNVGVITADIEPQCYGTKQSASIARAMFALPNVEASSHTHSHPLYWRFFADYNAEKEKPYLPLYPRKPAHESSFLQSFLGNWRNEWDNPPEPVHYAIAPRGKYDPTEEEALRKYYTIPRNYACAPFNLKREVSDSVTALNALMPKGKKVGLIQWSGDTSPFEAALLMAREAGVYNLNGGDSRFDSEYPSYASVAPIGLRVGNEQQIYSSNSNENTYTNLWSDRFFGFRYLQTTVENTETPIRVRPFNLYFHIYSGQKPASLNAIKANLDYARTQDIIPISATNFAAIANGFYTTRFIPAGENSWKIQNRGALNTIRLDDATLKTVDYEHSNGILGQRWLQGSLYVALDPQISEPLLTIKPLEKLGKNPISSIPYQIFNRWRINNLQINNNSLTFIGHGYGNAQFQWQMPQAGTYRIAFVDQGKRLKELNVVSDAYGLLTVDTDLSSATPITVNVSKVE